MFRREQFNPGNEGHPGEVVSQYQEVLRLIINGHEQGMSDIVGTYDDNINQLLDDKSSTTKKIDGVVEGPGSTINRLTGDTEKDLQNAVELAAEKCPKTLSREDQSCLSAAQTKARQVNLGVGFWQVDKFLEAASSRQARSTMRAALDNTIWRAAQAKARQVDLGIAYWQVDGIIQNASSREARAAMKAAIDKQIWNQAKSKAQRVDLGIAYWQVDGIIQNASSRRAVQALKSGVDKSVWAQAKSRADKVNITMSGWQVSGILDNISSRKLRGVMDPVVMTTTKSQQRTRTERDSSTRREQTPPFNHDIPNFEDMFRDMFDNGFGGTFGREAPPRGGQTRGRAAPPPRREQPRTSEAPRYQEVDEIVRKAVSAAPDQSWLSRTEKAAVQRVINSVRSIRQQAEQKGETVTDRQIYIMYRRKIESDKLDAGTKQRLTTSTQIVLALMGGKPTGKLPF